MLGILFCIIAGISMSFQGILNTRLSQNGLIQSNTIVQGSAFIITLIIMIIFNKFDFKNLSGINKIYLLGGALGVIITYTVMCGMGRLGATYAVSTILVAQLLSAALIDAFGLFGSKKVCFDMTKIIGISLMIVGIIIFKLKN